jgi:hypothetical protein
MAGWITWKLDNAIFFTLQVFKQPHARIKLLTNVTMEVEPRYWERGR